MEPIFIKQFEKMFNQKFDSVIRMEDIGIAVDVDDDGIFHYINLESKDVYSFDTFDNIWLEKNLYQDDVLHRLNIPV